MRGTLAPDSLSHSSALSASQQCLASREPPPSAGVSWYCRREQGRTKEEEKKRDLVPNVIHIYFSQICLTCDTIYS